MLGAERAKARSVTSNRVSSTALLADLFIFGILCVLAIKMFRVTGEFRFQSNELRSKRTGIDYACGLINGSDQR